MDILVGKLACSQIKPIRGSQQLQRAQAGELIEPCYGLLRAAKLCCKHAALHFRDAASEVALWTHHTIVLVSGVQDALLKSYLALFLSH